MIQNSYTMSYTGKKHTNIDIKQQNSSRSLEKNSDTAA